MWPQFPVKRANLDFAKVKQIRRKLVPLDKHLSWYTCVTNCHEAINLFVCFKLIQGLLIVCPSGHKPVDFQLSASLDQTVKWGTEEGRYKNCSRGMLPISVEKKIIYSRICRLSNKIWKLKEKIMIELSVQVYRQWFKPTKLRG